MNHILVSVAVGAFVMTLQSCGTAGFGGKTPSRSGVEHNGQTTPIKPKEGGTTPDGGKPGIGIPVGPNGPVGPIGPIGPGKPGIDTIGHDDQKTIDKCLRVWGTHPFANPYASVRKINAAVSVLGIGGGIKDLEVTPGPQLVIISAAVSVLGQTTMELRNPNGWYCLKVDVNVLNHSTINLDCRAKMADTRVDVNVLSNSDPTGVVGVKVLSDVKLNRVGC